jgi:hypothetical protein
MASHKIKREIVALFMESPLYFTIPLQKRLEFIRFFSQQPVFNNISNLNLRQMNGRHHFKQPDPKI